MKIFGFEIKRAKAAEDIAVNKSQYLLNSAQGPLTPWFQDYVLRKVSGDFYEALREGIPIIDAAIRRLISLNGTVKVIGTNGALVRELEDFCINVPVNDHQKGVHAFLENFSNEVFEQGFALPEFLSTPTLDDIAGLRVPDSKQIIFRRNAAGATEPWYRYLNNVLPAAVTRYSSPQTLVERILSATYNQAVYINSGWEAKLDPSNKMYFSINNENADPYGVSLLRSMEFCAKLLMTMQNSLGNVWERFGDPSYHIKYKTNKKDLGGDTLEARRIKIQTDFDTAIRAKRLGKSADFVSAVNTDADIDIKIIGHEGQVLELEIPAQHVLEQIVSKTGLPGWMLGIKTQTVQGMATLEVEAALQDAKVRQLAMLPELVRLFSIFLRLRGRSWQSINLTGDPEKPGDWGIIFETPNLRDLVAQAQARFLNAQADQMQSAATSVPSVPKTPPPKHYGGCVEYIKCPKCNELTLKGFGTCPHCNTKFHETCTCGCGCKDVHGGKETRPFPWPEMDDVETAYEDRLKADWEDLRQRVFIIARLTDTDIATGMAGMRSAKDSPAFTFSAEQRAAVMKELENFIGLYLPASADSPVSWYYGQSYSLGLIQAARMMGDARPILDIIKNSEIFDELVRTGFQLVTDNATKAITDQILAEMEAHVIAGSNPVSVASRLKQRFGEQNSRWERLARTEMADAAESAKTAEWKERKLKRVDFVPAPDACPICLALAGTYDLEKCPRITVHPRCRCSKRPAQSEA